MCRDADRPVPGRRVRGNRSHGPATVVYILDALAPDSHMMATTHVLAALVIASGVALVSPEFGAVAVVAAFVGGALPDFDLYAGHRKTLHFPVYFPAGAALAVPLALLVPTQATVGLAVLLLAAGLHSAMDALGGGLELRPWHGTSDRAVFSHYHGRWIPPRRLVRYDGAPEDLVLAGLLAIPGLVVFGSPVEEAIVVVLAISAVYVLLRKPLVRFGEWAVEWLPREVVEAIPDAVVGDFVESAGREREASGPEPAAGGRDRPVRSD